MTDTNGELRDRLFAGKTLKQNLRDIIARNNTGHSYDELVELVKDEENDEMLETDEVEQVDKTVNLLAHLFVSHVQAEVTRQKDELLDELEIEYDRQYQEKCKEHGIDRKTPRTAFHNIIAAHKSGKEKE